MGERRARRGTRREVLVMTDWKIAHLAVADPACPTRPGESAYGAMIALLSDRWLDVTRQEREFQVHGRRRCGPPECDVCAAMSYRAAQSATDKLHRHLHKGPPYTGGVEVRDWRTLLSWVRASELGETRVAVVRAGLYWGLPRGHPVLPLVWAVSAQLLPARPETGGARGPRRMRDAVSDMRRSVLAQQQGWAAKPERDFANRKDFEDARKRHPRGAALLVEVLKCLDYGDPEPYRTVLSGSAAQPGDDRALRDLLAELLSTAVTRDWFLKNVDSRQTYNQDLASLEFHDAVNGDQLLD